MRGGEPDSARLMRFVLEMRQAGVTDSRILGAMERTPRAAYAPEHMEGMAMADMPLPLPCGQTMSAPSVVGRVTSALMLTGGERVLEIGTGSGYQAGVLALAGARVTSLERHARLAADARAALGRQRVEHVQVYFGDGRNGYGSSAPYDRIVINASVEDAPPEALLAQLAGDGVIVGGQGADGGAGLVAWRREGGGGLAAMSLGPIVLQPLALAPANPQRDCSEP